MLPRQDGKRPSLLMFDELHRFTRKKAETVRTVLLKGMISRSPVVNGVQQGEPLMIQTTTSGDEQECPLWFSEYEYAQHVLDGGIDDPNYYAAIYQADRSASRAIWTTGNRRGPGSRQSMARGQRRLSGGRNCFSSGCRANGFPILSGARGLRLRVGRAPGSSNQLRAPRSI
jgi:hypothetical protein